MRPVEDTIDVDRSYAYRDYMLFDSGADADEVNLTNLNLYWNNQTSTYSYSPDSSLFVFTGEGNDDVTFENVNVQTGDVYLLTNGGNDTVNMDDVDVRDKLYADLGSGNDSLGISRSSAAVAELIGGSNSWYGSDSLSLSRNSFGSLSRRGFESKSLWYGGISGR